MPENGGNLNFIACLALHQNRRDSATGLTHVTKVQKGLLWYYNVKKQETYTKYFYYGVIQGARERIAQIKGIINQDTPISEARRLYNESLVLQQQIDNAEKIING